MKRAAAVLGAFAIIGLGVLLGAAPASAASCIQSPARCAPATTYDGAMTHDRPAGPDMTHDRPSGMPYDADVICRTFPPC